MTGDHVCDLNDRIDTGFGENAFTACTLDIIAEDSERGHFGPFTFGCVRYETLRSNRSHRHVTREEEFPDMDNLEGDLRRI